MLATYQAALKDNQLEWQGERPNHLAKDEAVSVYVTLLDQKPHHSDEE